MNSQSRNHLENVAVETTNNTKLSKQESETGINRMVSAVSKTSVLLSRSLALKLSNDIKDAAQLSSIQLFDEPIGSSTPSPPLPPTTSTAGAAATAAANDDRCNHAPLLKYQNGSNQARKDASGRPATSKSLSTNSKSLTSLLFINTIGHFSVDGTKGMTLLEHNHASTRTVRFKLARSESIDETYDNEDLDRLTIVSFAF